MELFFGYPLRVPQLVHTLTELFHCIVQSPGRRLMRFLKPDHSSGNGELQLPDFRNSSVMPNSLRVEFLSEMRVMLSNSL
jgi:hypothetical protein